MIAFLEGLKESHSDDASIQAFNEIENHIRDKKYGLVWEEHSEEVDDLLKESIPILTADTERRLCKDESLPWNFIIEGDNLQALYLLGKTHRGKVDCIYIDPPYNTGARDWKYNNDYVDSADSYRHSKWLSMMKNRLLLAQPLLNPHGSALICTIDEKEYLRLGCLLEELFPTANIQMITSIIKPEGTNRANEFSRTNEYIFFVMIGSFELFLSGNSMFGDNNQTDNLFEQETIPFEWRNLRRREKTSIRTARPNQFYPIFINRKTGIIDSIGEALSPEVDRFSVPVPDGCFALYPLSKNGVEMLWGKHYDTARTLLEKGYLKVDLNRIPEKSIVRYLSEGTVTDIESGKAVITGHGPQNEVEGYYNTEDVLSLPKTVWNVSSHNAQTGGSLLIKKIIGENRFDFPKSVYAVYDALRFCVGGKKDAVIVDFFSGSGTTGNAVNLLNKADGGNRKFIMVTNNELSESEEKAFEVRGIHKGDPEWEARGIARYVTWPRTVCSINGKNVFNKDIPGDYKLNDSLSFPISTGFTANVKYFKCDWTPRKPEDYLLSNVLCLHIKEMIELQNAIEVDNVNNVLILNKEDLYKTIYNDDIRPHIERVWVNQNIIFSTDELKALKQIGYKYIPREFFGQELREAAE